MEIKVEVIQVERLPKLPEGLFYTQSGEVEIQNRIVSNDYIWLGCNSTKDDWKIITQEEADLIISELNKLNEELQQNNITNEKEN